MSDPTKGFGPSDRTIAANQHYELVDARKTIERLTAELADERAANAHKEAVHVNLQARVEKLEGVRESVVKMGNDLRYEADDWAVDPELARQYIEPVYQTALAATEQGESDG